MIKGIHLEGLRKVGDPNELAIKYYNQGIDEIILMDAEGQGIKDGFDEKIFDYIPQTIVSRIYLSGGMNKSHISHSRRIGYSGVIIDNTSLYTVLNISERYFDAV